MNDDFGDDDDQQGVPSDVDWERYKVVSRAQGGATSPLGDPLRWGAELTVQIPAPPTLIESPQLLRVQATDGYPRSWSFVGTLKMPAVTWAAPVPDFGVVMQVTQGTGQARVIQEINLRLLCNIGLAVYSPSNPGGGLEERGFAGIGALIGNAISVRFNFGAAAAAVGFPAPVSVAVILTPYAAGTGL